MKNTKRIGLVFALAVMVSLFMMPNVFAKPKFNWSDLQAEFNKGGDILLDQDYTAGSEDTALEVPAGVTVTLDLNGYTIDRGLAEAAAKESGNVITVKGSLTIEDSSGDGKITGGYNNDNAGGVYVSAGGKLILSDGNIAGNLAKKYSEDIDACGGGVYIAKGGNFEMTGGTISDNEADLGSGVCADGGTFTMKGGTIKDQDNASNGGGVYVGAGGKVTQSGGTVKSNSALIGGGVYVGEGGIYTLDGGGISKNDAVYDAAGGGVYVDGGSFTMQRGTITGNEACTNRPNESAYGGGVYVNRGEFVMNGGTIIGNVAKGTDQYGHSFTTYGGGLYIAGGVNVTLNGGAVKNNSADYGGGLYIEKDASFTLEKGTISGNKADNDGGGVMACDSFVMNSGTISDNWAEFNGGGVCTGGGTLDMKGGTISGNTSDNGAGVYVGTNDAFNLTNGTISDNRAEKRGGGVYTCGQFTMTNGAISSNHTNSSSEGNAGGVYVCNGSFTMSNGSIDHNTAASDAGGVYVLRPCTFTMSGGTISDNRAAATGGGVLVSGNIEGTANFTMNGGTISGNKATSGGGVYLYLYGANMKMTGGTISGNSANTNGGGLFVGDKFTMEGGSITGNRASDNGGGIYSYADDIFLSGKPVIADNKKGDDDNNVYLRNKCFISIAGTLGNTNKIGILMEEPGVFTRDYDDKMGDADPKNFFKTDAADKGIKIKEAGDDQGEVMLAAATTYTVTFEDGLGNLLKKEVVEEDQDAAEPPAPTRSGYVFDGWDKDFSKVTSDMNIAAIWKISIDQAPVVLSSKARTYDNSIFKPTIKTIDGKKLTAGTDYTVAWSNASSRKVGIYTVTITGKGDYIGTTEAKYRIIPKGTYIKKLKKAKKAVAVKWQIRATKMSTSHITGYHIQLATDKQFTKNRRTMTVKGYKRVSKLVRRLKGGKRYYVRIRTYKMIRGKKIVSEWSKVKKIKTGK